MRRDRQAGVTRAAEANRPGCTRAVGPDRGGPRPRHPRRASERRDFFADDELAELIQCRRNELQLEALRAGERLYRRKPRKFARPLERGVAS